jgi:hypothetical protein
MIHGTFTGANVIRSDKVARVAEQLTAALSGFNKWPQQVKQLLGGQRPRKLKRHRIPVRQIHKPVRCIGGERGQMLEELLTSGEYFDELPPPARRTATASHNKEERSAVRVAHKTCAMKFIHMTSAPAPAAWLSGTR